MEFATAKTIECPYCKKLNSASTQKCSCGYWIDLKEYEALGKAQSLGPLNPWVTMWTRPRDTIQQIIETNPEQSVLILAAVAGFSEALDRASMKNLGDHLEWPWLFLIAAIIGSISGIIGLYIGGSLIRWTGTWIGGKAPSKNIRAAIAWSGVPIIWALLLWLPELALFGQDLFTTETPTIDASHTMTFVFFGFALAETIVAVWAIVISLKSLGQVQGFSAWKALGNVILAVLVILVPLLVIVFGIAVLV